MAYEYNAEQSQSILSQVAFYQATNYATTRELDLVSAEGQSEFEIVFSFLHDSLVAAERGAVAGAKAARPASSGGSARGQTRPSGGGQSSGRDAVDRMRRNFPGSTVENNLEILGDKSNEVGEGHPDWLFEQNVEAKVPKVWDNRLYAFEHPDQDLPWYTEALELPRGISREQKNAAYNRPHDEGGPFKFYPPAA